MADAKDARDQTGIAYSTDLITWTEALDQPVLPRRPGRFDSRVVEPGPPPILTPDGVLLIYNGADDRLVYRTGWALFDRNDPTRLLARSDQPLFEPVTDWEKVGQVPNVVFVEGLVVEPGRWLVYYGAADKYIGVASVAISRSPLIAHAQICQAAPVRRARPRGLWSRRPACGSGRRCCSSRPAAGKRLQEGRRGRRHRWRQPAGGQGRPGADARDGRLPGPRREDADRADDDLPLGVDHQDVHGHRDHAAAGPRPAHAGHAGRHLRSGAPARAQPVRRHLAGHHPHADAARRRLPRVDVAVGRRQAVAPVRADVVGAARGDAALHGVAVCAGHGVPLLEPRHRLPGPDHRGVERRGLRGLRDQEHPDAAGDAPHVLRSRRRTTCCRIVRTATSGPTGSWPRRASTSTPGSPSPTAA